MWLLFSSTVDDGVEQPTKTDYRYSSSSSGGVFLAVYNGSSWRSS